MITIILSVILFGFGGWFKEYNCHSGYIANGQDYFASIFVGCIIGFIVGVVLSGYLSQFVARKYPIDKKFPLLPFSAGEIYLVNNGGGDINYCRAEGDMQTAHGYDIAYIKVNKEEQFPYVAYCYPKRASFWGLFATFIMLSPSNIFVVPKETMIKKGRVDIITTTTHKLVLEP